MNTKRQIKRMAKQLYRMCLVNGMPDEERVRNVVERVIAANRRNGLAILRNLEHLVRLNSTEHSAKVESVIPLPQEVRSNIQKGLINKYGPTIRVSFAENPNLLGGLKIKIGSDLYDRSVQGELAELEKAFEVKG